ncbi:MAG: DMT family transporter [Alphaproteobacteria bacterium]|nr:DMT family transporter [Alphaproteobacteria bacterium]
MSYLYADPIGRRKGLRAARGSDAYAILVAATVVVYNNGMPRTMEDGAGPRSSTESFIAGALWMLLAALGFALMSGIIRHVSAQLDPFVIVFFRNLFGLMFMMPWLLRSGLSGLRTGRLRLHLLRAVMGLGGMLCWFWALSNMPMAEAVALNFTAPLFTTVLAIPLLGEVVHLRRWTATIVGFLGVLVILRPGMAAISEPAIVVLMASVFMAGAGILIKTLSRTEGDGAMVTYVVLFLTPMSLVPALFVWTMPSWTTLLWLAAIGGLATLAHQCLTRSFRAADASAIMPFDYARLPFVAAIGYVAFDQSVDVWTWVGGGIIAAAGLYIAHREIVLGRDPTAPLTVGDRAASGVFRGTLKRFGYWK